MEVMVVDGEVDAKNESYDDDSVAEGRFETTLVETVKTHRDECDADEGPVVDYCSGPDEEGEEMVVGEHPDAIGEENGHHCQSHRGIETAWLNTFRAPAIKMVSLMEQMKARSTRIA